MCFSTTMNQWEELNLMTNVWGEKEKKGDMLILILTKLHNDTRNAQIYLCSFPFLIYWNYILLYFSICVAVTSYVKKVRYEMTLVIFHTILWECKDKSLHVAILMQTKGTNLCNVNTHHCMVWFLVKKRGWWPWKFCMNTWIMAPQATPDIVSHLAEMDIQGQFLDWTPLRLKVPTLVLLLKMWIYIYTSL